MANLGIDLDGVCYDFTDSFVYYLKTIDWFNSNGVPEPDDGYAAPKWDFFEDWGITGREFAALCDDGVDAGIIFNVGDPFPDCIESLNLLKKEGHSIHVITHRMFGERSVHNTMDWINRHDLQFDSISFAEDKSIIGVDLLVDDYEGNWRTSLAQGIPCVIMDRPWNRHLLEAERVFGWQDFVHYVDVFTDDIDAEMKHFFGV